ncbi:uncharacterized protein AC631_03926 [Debaryomyces fabryi]|uniref:OPA3-like protein n=1 Tax=Debaryomyces fabryi TaxID=58627 RepID=A0A0V1PVN6_9ASCO|nr:uncharacterized protein AC631_03926 [Debaryomyces fabryi]KSA00312.1 hypothetical protein AC631_03926 [Debaryomyces fabryi]CUM56262.1 unnamed protein product [Debaryomyces fabryi]
MSGLTLKFTSLLIRTVAKPISNSIKAQAKEHEHFRRNCIRFAQMMHHADLKMRMNLLGEKKIKIRPLNDNKAIEKGANFLSEMFVFSVAGSLIFYESYRSRKKTNLEKSNVQDDITFLQDEIVALQQELEDVKSKLANKPADASGK